MSQRIEDAFARAKSENRAAFVAYYCAGDPDMEASLRIARALEKAGADVLELGVPFSDPLADGIVNQMAAQRALEGGATTKKVLDLIRAIRAESEIAIVLFTYLNPIYAYGFADFHKDAAAAGADGILLLDLPPDEEAENQEMIENSGMKHIRLIAPTTPEARMEAIAKSAEGFIYYVSREGVTGAQESLADTLEDQVAAIRRHTDLPIAVGFGISKPEHARQVAAIADGVVVGSAIVKVIEEHGGAPDLEARVEAFVQPLAAECARA